MDHFTVGVQVCDAPQCQELKQYLERKEAERNHPDNREWYEAYDRMRRQWLYIRQQYEDRYKDNGRAPDWKRAADNIGKPSPHRARPPKTAVEMRDKQASDEAFGDLLGGMEADERKDAA